MAELLDSGALRSGGYVVLAVFSVVIAVRERRVAAQASGRLWPTYWWLTAGVLLVVAVLHGTSLADLVAQVGRNEARDAGWYETRRSAQTVAVAGIAAVWVVSVVVAIWRVPPRRRRYLPSAVAVSALLAFIAVRAISLHQIDALVYRRDLAGVRFVAVIELGLLVVMGATMAVRFDPTRGYRPVDQRRRIRSTSASTRGGG